jgi:LPXTG-site transpeptidase (sortase) family protein
MKNARKKPLWVFISTFVPVFLLVFGGGTLFSIFVPPIVAIVWPNAAEAQLPIAPERVRSFVDINSIPAKNPFPSLATIEGDVATGDWIRVPKINANVPLVMSASLDDDDILATLDSGAALYPNGVVPGELGNTFVSAHSTGEPWKGKYRFAFLKINDLEDGDVINVDYDGARYTYRVFEKEIVTPTPDFLVVSDRPVPTLTLMACWPLWTTDQRMLISAELTNITKLTQRPAI